MLNSNYEEQTKKILEKKNFQSIRRIGKGGFGFVLLASRFNNCMSFYAIKCISLKNNTKDPHFKKHIQQQARIMSLINHPNVVGYQTSFQDCGWYFIVMEYCDLGSLMTYQTKNNNKYLGFSESCKILCQILRGLQSIHQRNIIHRDIKCQNIFLKKNKNGQGYICKIGDFGFAQIIQPSSKTICGTTFYMAPQILNKLPYSFEADIWAVGVVFYYMLFGQYPFKSINIQKQFIDKCSNGFKLNDLPPHLKNRKQLGLIENFFKRTFDLNQKTRIKLHQMINHPLFNSGDGQGTQDSSTDQQVYQDLQICLSKIKFVEELIADITKLMFLQDYLLCSARFYLFKIILSMIGSKEINDYLLDHPQHKLSLQIKKKQVLLKNSIILQLQNLKKYTKQTKKIDNFDKGLNLQAQNFYAIKQPYRNTLSMVYSEIGKKIPNQQLKSKLKFRVLCCHLINRVFNQGFKRQIFPNFNNWLDKHYKQNKKQKKELIQFGVFNKWISQQVPEKVFSQIDNINNRFYS